MSSDNGYTFAPRALKRWREERLTLTPREGGGWRARFHFDGSTCGNVAFVLHYEIEIDGRGIVVGMRAAPAPGDEGHESLCRHREDAASLRAELATPGPPHGRPLADILSWRPATSPAGCVCSAPARAHKWLAALQTLHFALHAPPACGAAAHAATSAGSCGVGTRPAGAAGATAASSSTPMPEAASASAADRDTPPSSFPPTSPS
jgi:hypothetical protein